MILTMTLLLGIEGVWAEDKVIGVCKAEIWYGAPLCERDATVVCSNSLPRTMHGCCLPTTVKWEKKIRIVRK